MVSTWIEKDFPIISIVNDHDPAAIPLVTQPIANKFENVGFRLVPTIDLDSFSNFSIAFFEPGYSTSMDPEYPSF
jgi:hypothetical protein